MAKLPPASVTDKTLLIAVTSYYVLLPVYVPNLMFLFLFPLLFGIAVYESASYNTQLGCLRKKEFVSVLQTEAHTSVRTEI